MGFGKNLLKIRKYRNVTQGQLAELVDALLPDEKAGKITQATVSKIERTDANTSDYIRQFAQVLHVTVEDLYNDDFARNFDPGYKVNTDKLIAGPAPSLPVYSIQELYEQGAKTMLTPPDRYAVGAFWVEIDDTSCEPHYPPSTRFLIKDKTPSVGALVLAKLPDSTNAIRIYKQPTPEGYQLAPINNNYAPYSINDFDRSKILGVVDYVACPPATF